MLFSSLFFLWVFLPVVLLGSRALPRRWVNPFLTIASLFFYAWGEPFYVLIMLASIAVNYTCGLSLDRAPSEGRRKSVLAVGIAINLLLLFCFKYLGLFVQTLNSALSVAGIGAALPVPEIALPIGISFFTFQGMSYVVDVYRGEVQAQKRPMVVALYISFFPQLIAGPIVRYKDICEQIENRHMTLEQFAQGARRFIYGLGKKVLISNVMAQSVDALYALDISREMDGVMAWCAAIMYAFQIYYDFSGYSDMAIGLGKMFGFEFLENFNYPYLSRSIREFWHRWHISLSTWFREYVYIPLGGNRKGVKRTYLNLLIVFFLTGIWHGAGYGFILCRGKAWLWPCAQTASGVLQNLSVLCRDLWMGIFPRGKSGRRAVCHQAHDHAVGVCCSKAHRGVCHPACRDHRRLCFCGNGRRPAAAQTV